MAASWVAMLLAACAIVPQRSAQEIQADSLTTGRVYAALEADPVFFFRHVDVDVDDGVAQLSGYVWTTDALYRAQQIARGVPGVTQVKDQMQLERAARRGGGGGTGSQ